MVDKCRDRSSWWPPCWTATTPPCSTRSVGTPARTASHDFLAQGARCGWCAHPIRLRGYVLGGADGHIVFSSHRFPDNVVLKACGSRSELRCPSCATLYRGDARHLIRAGLEGGKGVDQSIATHPAVLLTLTAPGFGPCTGTARPARAMPEIAEAAVHTADRSPAASRHSPRRRRHRHTAVPPLLRLRRRRAAQCLKCRTLAAHHHLRRPPAGGVHGLVTGRVRQGPPARTRQGRRVPAPRPGALPRGGPSRRS